MKKVDATVLRETLYVSVWVVTLSVLTQAVFLVIGQWDYTVLLGNLLSAVAGIANFFLMGLTVQSAVNKDPKDASTAMKLSQALRSLMVFAFAAVGVLLPVFSTWTTIIPLFFPTVAVRFRTVFGKNRDN